MWPVVRKYFDFFTTNIESMYTHPEITPLVGMINWLTPWNTLLGGKIFPQAGSDLIHY